jgi:hypothetical protein
MGELSSGGIGQNRRNRDRAVRGAPALQRGDQHPLEGAARLGREGGGHFHTATPRMHLCGVNHHRQQGGRALNTGSRSGLQSSSRPSDCVKDARIGRFDQISSA